MYLSLGKCLCLLKMAALVRVRLKLIQISPPFCFQQGTHCKAFAEHILLPLWEVSFWELVNTSTTVFEIGSKLLSKLLLDREMWWRKKAFVSSPCVAWFTVPPPTQFHIYLFRTLKSRFEETRGFRYILCALSKVFQKKRSWTRTNLPTRNIRPESVQHMGRKCAEHKICRSHLWSSWRKLYCNIVRTQ